MEWHWIYWVIIAIAAFIIVGLERRQDRRHNELIGKINDLHNYIERRNFFQDAVDKRRGSQIDTKIQ